MDPEALRDTLELAVLPVLDGSPPGPLLASRVHREVVAALARLGLRGDVQVRDGGRRVDLRLRRAGRVERLNLRLFPR